MIIVVQGTWGWPRGFDQPLRPKKRQRRRPKRSWWRTTSCTTGCWWMRSRSGADMKLEVQSKPIQRPHTKTLQDIQSVQRCQKYKVWNSQFTPFHDNKLLLQGWIFQHKDHKSTWPGWPQQLHSNFHLAAPSIQMLCVYQQWVYAECTAGYMFIWLFVLQTCFFGMCNCGCISVYIYTHRYVVCMYICNIHIWSYM